MEKLTKTQQCLVDTLMNNLDKGYLWKQGWKGGAQMSIKGSIYRGINALLLTLISMERGYADNRWITYNAMHKSGYVFKKPAKGQGVPVEYFEQYDKKTKKPFDSNVLIGMGGDERREYMEKNVYMARKAYIVFNCDLVQGVPEKDTMNKDEINNERIDNFLIYYSDKECPIVYGGNEARYVPSKDEIDLPSRESFFNNGEFYTTAMHEVAHSTGSEKRLNRDLTTYFGSSKYAREELVAEISSLLISQEFGTQLTDSLIENAAAYIDAWKKNIKDDPGAIIKAVNDAVKVNKYLIDVEVESKKA